MATKPPVAQLGYIEDPRNAGGLGRILPLVLLLYVAVLLPPEVRLQIAGLQIYSYRMILLPALFLIVYRFTQGSFRLIFPDFCVLIAGAWSIAAFTYHYGFAEALVSAGAGFIDFAGSYFLARACIKTETDLRRMIILIVPALMVAATLLLMESLGHRIFVRPFFASVFGMVSDYSEGSEAVELVFRQEVRLGMMRAYGTFGHPILGGMLLSSALPLIWLSGVRSWPRIGGAMATFGGIFTVSSAAILGGMIGVAVLAIDYVRGFFRNVSWPVISSFVVLALVIVQFATQSGVINLLSRATLNPATAFTRQAIWRYGMQSIGNHPWFGIGRDTYERPANLTASVDAHFLAQGISSGAITPVATLLAIFYLLFALGKRASRKVQGPSRDLAIGMNFTIFLLFFGGLTVTYFSDVRIWFMAMLGVGASLAALGKLERPLAPLMASSPIGSLTSAVPGQR